jgi:cytochrome c oxidase subunit 3
MREGCWNEKRENLEVMATTVHEPPKTEVRRLPARAEARNSGNGGWRNLVPSDGNLRAVEEYSPPPSSSAIWVGIAAITMSFAAFTSALIVRQGSSTDWRHITLPSILYLSTLLLLISSVTLEVSRRRVATFMGGLKTQVANPGRWLYVTLSLGLLFVAGQYMAWLQLRSKGLYLATNPNSSFFYVFTAVHALHVLGGLGGLVRVIYKLRKSVLRRSTLDATSYYWHFMGVLWLYLFLLLRMKL